MKNKPILLGLSSIYSGAGMGLLLGIIMGLSVEPSVKIVMGVLTAALGAFLGFDKRNFKEVSNDEIQKENSASIQTSLRAGSFGLAVIAGIYFGLITRTNELFAPTPQDRVKAWVDAGVDRDYATKLVIFQKLGLDPNTGEQADELTVIQKGASSNLFGVEEIQNLVGALDPDLWSGDIDMAIKDMQALDVAAEELTELVISIKESFNSEVQFPILKNVQNLVYQLEIGDPDYCNLSDVTSDWTGKDLQEIVNYLVMTSPQEESDFKSKLISALCTIQTAKSN
jgi:uncharacterized membrane protein (Fun14 family)